MKLITPTPMVSDRAAEEIRAAILNGTLAPGSRVRQEELAEKLGVSREPVRKALALLEKEGLVNSVPNRGAIIAPLDAPFIDQIYEFREAVETYVAAKVAEQGNLDCAAIRGVIAEGRKALRAGSRDRLIESDLAFHSELYKASGNPVVVEVMRTQWSHISRAMLMTLTVTAYQKQVWDEHEAIVEAIVMRDTARARELSSEHIRGAQALLRANLDQVIGKTEGADA